MQERLREMVMRQISYNDSIDSEWHERNFSWRSAVWIEGAKIAEAIISTAQNDKTSDKVFGLQLLVVSMFKVLIGWIYVEERGDVAKIRGRIESGLLRPAMASTSGLHVIECFCAHTLVNDMPSVPLFRSVMDAAGLSFGDLYNRYIGVSVLNKFREDNSFRDGGYKSDWGGGQDIFYLKCVVESIGDGHQPNLKEIIYRHLDNFYRDLVLKKGASVL